jgi:hypothetical protein
LADNKRALSAFVFDRRAELCDVLIWDKGRGAPQMQSSVLTNQFEFVYVFGGNGSRSIPHSTFHGTVANVIRIDPGQNVFSDEHKAVFPVDLPIWVMRELCTAASSVIDPFCGTGTTMIAAEQLGRTCYGIDVDPVYCQITIDRWEAFTGQKAVKVG